MATSAAEAPTAAEEEDLGAQVYLTLTQEDLLDRTSLAYYPAEWASWTKPRQAAWAALPTEPNAYFMAYLAPGERAASGAFRKEERALLQRLAVEHAEKVARGAWGFLAHHVPGRTGTQCKAAFEKLKAGTAEESDSPTAAAAEAAAAAAGIAAAAGKASRRKRDRRRGAGAKKTPASAATVEQQLAAARGETGRADRRAVSPAGPLTFGDSTPGGASLPPSKRSKGVPMKRVAGAVDI